MEYWTGLKSREIHEGYQILQLLNYSFRPSHLVTGAV